MNSPITSFVLAPLAALLVAMAPAAATAANALPTLHAAPARTSVSGLSSGAFMAVQYGVAFSSSVAGIGVIAGGPYNCAGVNMLTGGVATCMAGVPSGVASWVAAQGFANFGQIDPVAGIAKMKVYVFGGMNDQVVFPPVVAATRDFFTAAGVTGSNLAYVNTVPAGHAFITPVFGNSCATNGAPFIGHCMVKSRAYDQSQEVLKHIYGPLKPAVAALSTTVVPFDQREFAGASTGLDDIGFVYVPKSCTTAPAGRCAVHVVLHGCMQGAEVVGSDVYGSAGYNRWADSNNLIVLYPQVAKTVLPFNLPGCWDWMGYTGPNFQVRSGVQLAAVKAMVDRLTTP
jgi:poly(3-hydroxybutyrate) depolymerase